MIMRSSNTKTMFSNAVNVYNKAHITMYGGIDASVAPTIDTSVYNMTNLDINTDGSVSLRKPLVYKANLKPEGVLTSYVNSFTYLNNWVVTSYDATSLVCVNIETGEKQNVFLKTKHGGVDSSNTFTFNIVYNDKKATLTISKSGLQPNTLTQDGVVYYKFSVGFTSSDFDFSVAYIYTTDTVITSATKIYYYDEATQLLEEFVVESYSPPSTENSFDFSEAKVLNTASTTLIMNVKVNLKNLDNGHYFNKNYNDTIELRSFRLIYDNSKWTLDYVDPSLVELNNSGDFSINANLALKNAYAVTDSYNTELISVTGFLFYAFTRKQGTEITVETPTLDFNFENLTVSKLTSYEGEYGYRPFLISKDRMSSPIILKAFMNVKKSNKIKYYCIWERTYDGVSWEEIPEFYEGKACLPIIFENTDTDLEGNTSTYIKRYRELVCEGPDDFVRNRPDCLIFNKDSAENYKIDNATYRFIIRALHTDIYHTNYDISLTTFDFKCNSLDTLHLIDSVGSNIIYINNMLLSSNIDLSYTFTIEYELESETELNVESDAFKYAAGINILIPREEVPTNDLYFNDEGAYYVKNHTTPTFSQKISESGYKYSLKYTITINKSTLDYADEFVFKHYTMTFPIKIITFLGNTTYNIFEICVHNYSNVDSYIVKDYLTDYVDIEDIVKNPNYTVEYNPSDSFNTINILNLNSSNVTYLEKDNNTTLDVLYNTTDATQRTRVSMVQGNSEYHFKQLVFDLNNDIKTISLLDTSLNYDYYIINGKLKFKLQINTLDLLSLMMQMITLRKKVFEQQLQDDFSGIPDTYYSFIKRAREIFIQKYNGDTLVKSDYEAHLSDDYPGTSFYGTFNKYINCVTQWHDSETLPSDITMSDLTDTLIPNMVKQQVNINYYVNSATGGSSTGTHILRNTLFTSFIGLKCDFDIRIGNITQTLNIFDFTLSKYSNAEYSKAFTTIMAYFTNALNTKDSVESFELEFDLTSYFVPYKIKSLTHFIKWDTDTLDENLLKLNEDNQFTAIIDSGYPFNNNFSNIEFSEAGNSYYENMFMKLNESNTYIMISSDYEFAYNDLGNSNTGDKLYWNHRIFSYNHPEAKNNILVSDSNSFDTPLLNTIDLNTSSDSIVTTLVPWRDYLIAGTETAMYLIRYQDGGFYSKAINTYMGISRTDADTCKAILNGLIFKSKNKIYVLQPSLYSSDDTILNIKDITTPISEYVEDFGYNNFALTTEDAYYLFMPSEKTTRCLKYDFDRKIWTKHEYPIRLTNYKLVDTETIYLFDNNCKIYRFENDYVFKDEEDNPIEYGDVLEDEIVPFDYLIDSGQKVPEFVTLKKFKESRLIVSSYAAEDVVPINMEVIIDGDKTLKHIDSRTDSSTFQKEEFEDFGILNTTFLNNSTSEALGVFRQLILKYSGKGRSARHLISGKSYSNFKIFMLYYRYRISNNR